MRERVGSPDVLLDWLLLTVSGRPETEAAKRRHISHRAAPSHSELLSVFEQLATGGD
jgi:hypothetical protein